MKKTLIQLRTSLAAILLMGLLSLLFLPSCRKDKGIRGDVLYGYAIERVTMNPIPYIQVKLVRTEQDGNGQTQEIVLSEAMTDGDGLYVLPFPKAPLRMYFIRSHSPNHFEKELLEDDEDLIDHFSQRHDFYLSWKVKATFRVKNVSGNDKHVDINAPRDHIYNLRGNDLDTTFHLYLEGNDTNRVEFHGPPLLNHSSSNLFIPTTKEDLKDTILLLY